MLIRLDSQTRPEHLTRAPAVGDKFFLYFLHDLYDKGEVIEADPEFVTVDFGDTIKRFRTPECTLVFSATNLDHLMTCTQGEIVRDFRDGSQSVDNAFEDFEEVLDFSQWMV